MPLNRQYYRQNNKPTSLLGLLVATLFLLIPIQATAFTATSNEPIKIQSDHAELDESKGRSVYTGDVVITQGTTVLTSDKVIVYTNKSGLVKLEAFGEPAKFTHQQEGEALPTHAYGKKITYTRADENLTLEDEAKLEQGKNTFRGTTIQYNTVSRVVTADGGEQKSQRVEIIVHPVTNESGETKE